MKELVYRTIDGLNHRKKEISIEERDDRTKTPVAKKWIFKYFVTEMYFAKSEKDLKKWIDENQKEAKKKNKCHILKWLDTRTGETKVIFKVFGEFFVVNGLVGFRIVYLNSLKIHIFA